MSAPTFQPCGIITLTTDFGQRDPFVGLMKARILERLPQARIVDLTHEVTAHAPEEAGFWLARSFEYFPAGTVHVAVVDPGVGTARAILCAASGTHLLLAPDNGLLGAVAARTALQVRGVLEEPLQGLRLPPRSATFHGRDLFAPLAAELASGRCTPAQLGPPVEHWERGSLAAPLERAGRLQGQVVTIDHFGNLITNIEASALARLPHPQVSAGGRVLALHRTYGDARVGELLTLINSFGVLEIAQRQGSASATLGLGRGASIEVSSGPAST
jgi:S-adenosyl-L-methionine hydrolase (adenosine-forming)